MVKGLNLAQVRKNQAHIFFFLRTECKVRIPLATKCIQTILCWTANENIGGGKKQFFLCKIQGMKIRKDGEPILSWHSM